MNLRILLMIALSFTTMTASSRADDLTAAVQTIDQIMEAAWQRDEIEPVHQSDDAEFCRRVWLDLAGVAPTVTEARSFLLDSNPTKRGELIDKLLASPQCANHMANRWNEILLPADAQAQGQQQNVVALHEWLRLQFRNNIPYDYFVGGFLTAGGAGDAGPAIFYTSHALEPEKLAAATSRIFMGIQLQCAQCHDHPFDRWTQEDFWRYAAFFSQLQTTDQQGRDAMIEDHVGGEVMLPDTTKVMEPRYPGVSEPPEADPADIRRRQLTIWMASRDNPYFARAAVNRVWGHLFGRGIVDPIDAMDADNEPSHPRLLEYLAEYFTEQRFDLRSLYAAIARSKAYGLTSQNVRSDRPAPDTFAAMTVKTLSAEQFYDSLQQNVFRRAANVDLTSAENFLRQQFLNRMQAPGTSSRDYPHGVVQVLGMMNGPEMDLATSLNGSGLMGTLQAPFFSDRERVETLYLATLSRFPSEHETLRFEPFLKGAESAEQQLVFSDLLWALLNSAECAVCP